MKWHLIFPLLILADACFDTSVSADVTRPNILYFYVDDMGWGSIGPNGQASRMKEGLPYVQTPNLDRLAAQGLNFTRGYGCHVCSPARSSQQTGFHQGHTFADRNDPDNARKAIRADDICIGDLLSSSGYVTGYWGKWGYGGSKNIANPVIDNLQTLPTSHGYSHVLAELHHVRAHTFFQPTLWHAPAGTDAIGGLELIPNSMASYQQTSKYPATPALQNHKDYPEIAYCDDAYAMAALDFVRNQGVNYNETGQPFFGLLAVQIPHAPFGEISKLPEWSVAYADAPYFDELHVQSQQWASMVTRIDAHFGNILAALEDPNGDGNKSDSIADNTLVVFQSDNGGPSQKSNVEFDANGGLSGSKGSIQEGGIRVPLVMRWPAKINLSSTLKAGTNCNMVVDVTDLMPTFCELAGALQPLGIDGVSIAPTLTGEGHQRKREFIIHEAGNGQSIIRGKHKLIRAISRSKGSKGKGKVNDKERPDSVSLRLYDLELDPAEKNDLAPGNRKMVKQLEALLLGERVTEPKGFANTYHHWMGDEGAITSNSSNWSNYEYANAGITYLSDAGAPQISWVARLANSGDTPKTARADRDLEFLALGICGNSKTNATQSLSLGANVGLTARNELRIEQSGVLSINGGTIASLRWVDVLQGGTLNGNGTIDATVFNNGVVAANGKQNRHLHVNGDYHQSVDATLSLVLDDVDQPLLEIKGSARIDGELEVVIAKGFQPEPDKIYTLVKADAIAGTFANTTDGVLLAQGSRLLIDYTDTTVTLTLAESYR